MGRRPTAEHGTRSRYGRPGDPCRCALCREAVRKAAQDWRDAARADGFVFRHGHRRRPSTRVPVLAGHGTPARYQRASDPCRCTACRAAWSRYQTAARKARATRVQ